MKRNLLWPMGLVILMGCGMSNGGSIFNKEPFVDAKKDAQGNVVLLDTPRMWQDFTGSVDFNIANEVKGVRPPGGAASWNERWIAQIKTIRAGGQENPEKYVAYIIESRRRAGLPELEGYPP